MDCKEIGSFLQVYLDGELEEQDRRVFEEHLHACDSCRFQADYERRFRESIRVRMPKSSPSAKFKARLVEQMAGVAEGKFLPKRLVLGSVPALVVLGLVIAFTWTVTSGFSGLVNQAVEQHSTAPPVEVNTSNSEEVEDWFKEKVNFNVALPRFGAKKISLIGARLSHLAEQRAALVRYRRGVQNFSLFVLSDPGGDLQGKRCRRIHSQEICLTELRGYTVVLWRSRGLAYSLVGDSAPQDIVKVLSSARSF